MCIKKKKDKPNKSFRYSILILIVLCWVVPVSIIFIFISMSYRNGIVVKTETLIESEVKNFVSFTAHKINQAISISKKVSYESTIEAAWKDYREEKITETELHMKVINNLSDKFYIDDKQFVISVVYLCENPNKLYYSTRNTYDYINIYKEEVHEEALKVTGQDTTDVYVKIINGKIYVIRNLYTINDYTKFGTLVIELDKNKLFENSIERDGNYNIALYINDANSKIMYDNTIDNEKEQYLIKQVEDDYFHKEDLVTKVRHDRYEGFFYQKEYNDYTVGATLLVDRLEEYEQLNDLTYIILLILSIIIPILAYMLYFISHHITVPMGKMIEASKLLEKGKIGMQIETNTIPNTEFSYLIESFNKMSLEVKYLFDFAYNEKLARKDAKIIALQSQINPHFLNNTLEMMNWQARMAGDVAVSKMIEALSTLLDYSMDRSNKRLIRLSEELRCSEAYFYIISMRFGQRLRITKEIDDNLLQLSVPQLILQPLLENAVKHGIEKVKNGMIKLHIHRNEDEVIMRVINTGNPMSQDDEDRVETILNCRQDELEKISNKHVTLGIRNVNERIKLIYGKNYGLSIKPLPTGETAATIRLPYEFNAEDNEDNLLKDMLDL